MLRPWVPLIALGLLLALGWLLHPSFLAWVGGGLLAAALLGHLFRERLPAWKAAWRRRKALAKAAELDWKIIDQSMARERIQRDCERPETLGQCSGRDCLVYDRCDFNIKKRLP